MGIRDGKVIHHHFSKKMSSLEVVLGRSAMSMGSKLSILSPREIALLNSLGKLNLYT